MKRKHFLHALMGLGSILTVPVKTTPKPAAQETLLYEVYVAGIQHLEWWNGGNPISLNPGTLLRSVREPHNPFDRWAIALYTPQGSKLGYLPHWIVHIPSRLVDSGHTVRCRVVKYNRTETQAPWHTIKVAIYLAH